MTIATESFFESELVVAPSAVLGRAPADLARVAVVGIEQNGRLYIGGSHCAAETITLLTEAIRGLVTGNVEGTPS